jgi:hypothetical protein
MVRGLPQGLIRGAKRQLSSTQMLPNRRAVTRLDPHRVRQRIRRSRHDQHQRKTSPFFAFRIRSGEFALLLAGV